MSVRRARHRDRTQNLFDHLHSLDPSDWGAFRGISHQALDDILDYISEIRQRPVWQPADAATEQRFQTHLPQAASSLSEAYATFQQHILPFAVRNAHPGCMGWVHGGGDALCDAALKFGRETKLLGIRP